MGFTPEERFGIVIIRGIRHPSTDATCGQQGANKTAVVRRQSGKDPGRVIINPWPLF